MDNFYKRFLKYKEEYISTIDDKILQIKINNNDIIKEEIYNLINNYIGVFDITNTIRLARKDAIDYDKLYKLNNCEIQNQLIFLEENMTLINKKIVLVQKKIIIDENNILDISNRIINLFIFNNNNIQKFKKLLDQIDNNNILLAKINSIDINTLQYNNSINNGYNIEMINKITNNKLKDNKLKNNIIKRFFLLLSYNLTQKQKDLELDNLITYYYCLLDRYNAILQTANNLNRNLKISYDRMKEIIIENIIIVNKYLILDDTINETFLKNEKFFNEIRYDICNKDNLFKYFEHLDYKRLSILKKYLLEKLINF
jgi:hypothetical protein